MGRRRKPIADMPLPPGLFKHRRQFRARLSTKHPWQYFGTDYPEATKGYAAWKASGGKRNTFAWLLDLFTGVACPAKVKAGQLAPRTAKDYSMDAELLKVGLGHFALDRLTPAAIVAVRDEIATYQPKHVRNLLACGSAACAWAVETAKMGSNPFREVRRPRKTRRERLITHDEYLTVYGRAGTSERRAMVLAVRTLANPADVLALGPRNVVRTGPDQRVLRFQRGKTRIWVEVAITGELAQLVDEHLADKVVRATFVHREDGEPYTVDGIGAMFRRHCVGTKEKPANPKIADFGLRDLRPKGATDMFREGRPIREIQALLGHKSVQTTEIYLRELIPQTVQPNHTAIVSSVK